MGRAWLKSKGKSNQTSLEGFIARELELSRGYASGEIIPHFYWGRIAKEYGAEVDRTGRAYLLHVQPVREMWNLLSELHEQFNLGLFSDCSLDKKEVIRSAYALTDYFDYLIFTCDVRMLKRDPVCQKLMTQNGLYQAEECLLIDDSMDNLNVAATLGFQTHIFTDYQMTKTFLSSLNANLNDYSR